MQRLIAVYLLATVVGAVAMVWAAQNEKSEPRKVAITAKKFEFAPNRIEVKVGETIELTATSVDAKHGLECEDLGIKKVTFQKDKPVTVTFTATTPGTYEFKCANFCGSGHRRMKGQIIVSP